MLLILKQCDEEGIAKLPLNNTTKTNEVVVARRQLANNVRRQKGIIKKLYRREQRKEYDPSLQSVTSSQLDSGLQADTTLQGDTTPWDDLGPPG